MTLHVETLGNGRDLVLLHGWGCGGVIWDELASLLAQQFRVHCVDLPGYGNSPACIPYAPAVIVDALAASMPPHALVCGWSLGGQLALAWALQYPPQVERLILIATTPRFVQHQEWISGMAADEFAEFEGRVRRDSPKALQRFALLQSAGDDGTRRVTRRLTEKINSNVVDAAVLGEGMKLLAATDLRDGLSQVRQPALVIHGANDRLVPPAAAKYLAQHLCDARLELMAGAAHAPFVTQPARCARDITEFCGER